MKARKGRRRSGWRINEKRREEMKPGAKMQQKTGETEGEKKTVRQRKRDGGTAAEEQQEVSPACVTRPGQSHVAAAREGLHFGQFFRSSVPMIRASSFPGEQFSETQYPLMGSCHWGGGVPC